MLIYLIFSFFFSLDFLFGWFVFNHFINVINLAKYVQINYIFENSLYTNIGLTQIMSFLTMTSNDIAYDLGYIPKELNDQY